MIIRQAKKEDVQVIEKLGQSMHQESQQRQYNYDSLKVQLQIHKLIEYDYGIALVAEQDNKIVGGFLGGVFQHYYGNDIQAFDYALFVDPSYRNTLTGYRLIKAYIDEAKKKQADEIMLANSTGVDQEVVAKLIQKAGFEKQGYVFTMRGK